MPMRGYLKTSDRTRISTISVDGRLDRRKKIELTRFSTKSGRSKMYVRDCVEHDSSGSMGGLLPVELFGNTGKTWASLGVFKCCVLCWRIIDPAFPVVSEQPAEASYEEDKTRTNASRARKVKKTKRIVTSDREERIPLADKVWEFLDVRVNEWFTTQEIMAAVGSSRAGVINVLKPLVAEGAVEVIRGGHGMGDSTKYSHQETEA